jgi:hypothetical protein
MDETEARAKLVEMMERLADGPYAALGIPTHATDRDIRSAFLQLTKKYHPARFGRLSTETQRMSNEVFLALRAAHDSIAKPRTRGGPPANQPIRGTAQMPAVPRPPSGNSPAVQMPPGRAPTGQQPAVPKPPVKPATGPQPAVAQGTQRPSSPAGIRPPTPPAGAKPTQPLPVVQPRTPAASNNATASGGIPALDRELVPIYELLKQKQWEKARRQLEALVARTNDPKHQALVHYTNGREAQLGGDRRGAQIELELAIKADPELQLARSALTELFPPRK